MKPWCTTNLLDEHGEALVAERLGEGDALGALGVDGERRDDEVGRLVQQLAHHAVPLAHLRSVLVLPAQPAIRETPTQAATHGIDVHVQEKAAELKTQVKYLQSRNRRICRRRPDAGRTGCRAPGAG